MQCPPRPGPGKNDMKPNGLVPAARITSHTSMPIGVSVVFSSFTSAMLTARKIFSSNLALSAISALDTSITSLMPLRYTAAASSVACLPTPPTNFGMVLVEWLLRPGSSRSGLKAAKISSPKTQSLARAPAALNTAGIMSSRVVPGYVVLSRTISCPLRNVLPIASAVCKM